MSNQAFDVRLFLAGVRGTGAAAAEGLSMEGTAYEVSFLGKHLPGTAKEAKAVQRIQRGHSCLKTFLP